MSTKKEIRAKFRNSCFIRDKYRCVMCSFQSSVEKALTELDAHHIINRKEIPNEGYTPLNGISLCHPCHEKAEQEHATGIPYPGYTPTDLFKAIKSSPDQAIIAAKKLK